MLDAYARAVIDERRRPHHLDGLATFVRWEYPPGTEPYYILAEAARQGRRGRRKGNRFRKVLNALLRMTKTLFRKVGRPREAKIPRPAR